MSEQNQFASEADVFASPNVSTASIRLIGANQGRLGLLAYNNSGNSVYICFGRSGDSGNNMTAIIGAYSNWVMPHPIFLGEIWGKRNSGSGTVVFTELHD